MGASPSQPFGLADDGFRIGQFRGIGNTFEEVLALRLGKRIVAFVSKCLDTLIPCQKHAFSKIAKLGVFSDGFMDMGGGVGDGFTDGFDHRNLLPEGDSKFQGNEVFEVFSRRPSLLAHEANARRLVLIARVNHRGRIQVGRHLWEHHPPAGAKYPLRRAQHHSASTPDVKPSKQRHATSTPLFFDPEEGLGRSRINTNKTGKEILRRSRSRFMKIRGQTRKQFFRQKDRRGF